MTQRSGRNAELPEVEEALRLYGVSVTAVRAGSIAKYLEAASKKRDWAGLYSRTFATEPVSAVLDSLGVLSVIDPREEVRVADVGSGGGLLGVVLAVACDAWKLTLIESRARKSAALAEIAGSLGLGNVEVFGGRAEDLAGRRSFDAAVSRAAGSLADVAPVALGLLEAGGLYVAVKGTAVDGEVRKLEPLLGGLGAELAGVFTPRHESGGPARSSLVVTRRI